MPSVGGSCVPTPLVKRSLMRHHVDVGKQCGSVQPSRKIAFSRPDHANSLHMSQTRYTRQTASVHLRAPTGTVSELADVCEAFSKEFAKNFNSLSNSICSPISTKENSTSASLSSVNVDVVTVHLALARLCDSAAGPDGLPALFYGRLAYGMAVPLSIVY